MTTFALLVSTFTTTEWPEPIYIIHHAQRVRLLSIFLLGVVAITHDKSLEKQTVWRLAKAMTREQTLMHKLQIMAITKLRTTSFPCPCLRANAAGQNKSLGKTNQTSLICRTAGPIAEQAFHLRRLRFFNFNWDRHDIGLCFRRVATDICKAPGTSKTLSTPRRIRPCLKPSTPFSKKAHVSNQLVKWR